MRKFVTIIFLLINCLPFLATAASFTSLNEYLSNLGGAPSTTQVSDHNATHVFGIAQWLCAPSNICESGTGPATSIYVLKILSNGELREIQHSKMFEWKQTAKTPTIDRVEQLGDNSFNVTFNHFSPTGNETYSFEYRDSVWLLTNSECGFITMRPEYGDEAVGDTSSNKSINYLTGHVIETEFRGNKLYSEKKTNLKPLRILLANFSPYFSEEPDFNEYHPCP